MFDGGERLWEAQMQSRCGCRARQGTRLLLVDVLIKLLCKTDERVPDSRLVRVQFVHLCRLRPFIKLYNEQLNASEVTNKKR